MAHSMTAFARRDADTEWGSLAWEVRSVNHRYLEVSSRLPDELRSLEPKI
ncbi:MAG: YicC/YloC family endoribonuclease, partial [Acidiferrobacterales bacterium]